MKTTKQNKINNIQYEFKCNICTKRFFNKTLLQQHKKIHNMTYSCKLCSYSGKTVKYLSRHTKKVHTEPTISCNVCDKKFHFQCNLKQHLLVHTGAKPHKCKVCGKGFNSSYSLSTHQLIHENLKPYLCTVCDYACRDSSTLRKHKDRHLGIVKRYQCELCPRLFNANIYLKMHMDEKHFGINVHKISCKFCDKMFKSNSTLNMHIRTIHGRQYECECAICGTICKDKGNLRAHMMCHVDIRPYKCTYKSCGKKFKCMSDLKKHIIIHYPEQQHKCFCGRRFARKHRYDVHIKQHKHKEKTIQCDMCGEWFNNKSQIKLHIAKIHIDRYICDVCGYQTNNKTSIVVHIKEGHNQSCNICGETFERHLKLHYLKCHSIKYKKPRLKHKEVLEETDFKKEIENMELFEVEKQEILSDIEHEETNIRENHRIGETINYKINLEKELNRPVNKATIINKNVDLIEKIKRINVTVKIDKKAKENAEKHIQKLLDKSTRQKEMKELEETRQMYNERIRQAINSKPRKGPVIKFIKINNNANENNESQNNDIQSQFNDAKINDNEIVRRNNKLKINTHQCYVCFKLFETKPKLIEHCIEHFDVCCDVMLKKCPLCDYVTKLNLSRHMKLIHKINIQLPYTRFKDKKHNNNGSRYYYDINNKNIDKIEIIPSAMNGSWEMKK
ncbi:PREDICTED: zinc finger protein 93-like [Papilio xuthus]|uniref:Zinc finger protein 93-like n=1 Tax=Papilio xuthus TaxID=66420 RepID=A0AAJ6Z1K9_PAPXU|nr:PREDICTED: zinc finger protein 93-like [Papilio xuthus]